MLKSRRPWGESPNQNLRLIIQIRPRAQNNREYASARSLANSIFLSRTNATLKKRPLTTR